MLKNILHRLFFPHPPEVVWEHLTKTDLIAQWLMANDFAPVVGHEFQFRTNPIPKFDFDGIVYCKVLEIDPLRKLSYSWKGGPEPGKINMDSVVVWTLNEKKDGTELQIEHGGFKEGQNVGIYNSMNEGWLKNIRKMNDLIKPEHDTTHA